MPTTISVHRVHAALGGARRLGIDPVPPLQAARIPPLLLGDDAARVTAEQFASLVRELRLVTGDEFLGLGPAPSRPGTFAMMCYACVGCPDLGSALKRAARFYGLFPGGPRLALEQRGGQAVFAVHSDLRGHPEGWFMAECLLLIWHRLASWLIGRRITLNGAEFGHGAPPGAADCEAMFGCPVRFRAARTGAAFDTNWLAAPVLRDETGLDGLLRRAPADLLGHRAYRMTVTEQVRRALGGALRAGPPARLPEMTELAARLAVSPATLRRRLGAEGTSYRRLRDQVRREAALAQLAGGREPIAELAARLGFSEDTAFHRAFRRWTGRTPGAYRAELPHHPGPPSPLGPPGPSGLQS
ncbi:AraC family transcriptional regulator [Streptomyces orinoci]|uniref:AraC family transcriptional regulator n=1 Tax=Streptomyces orinoci TaxID=67339 RepID=A0ABV3K3Q8_STRON|nr:AraC family transcriptional regulator [Streptomyces orinoci]